MDLSEMRPHGDPFAFGNPTGPPTSSLEEQENERRRLESEHIAKRYAEELSKRGMRSNFSPEYLATLPRSMAEKLRVTPEEEEEVLYHFAATASIQKTSAASGVSAERVRAIVYNPQSQDAIYQYRAAMRVSVIDKMKETQYVILDAIQDPHKIEQASITQLAAVLEVVSATQVNLQEAEITASRSTAGLVDPSAVFEGEELEYMALLRRRIDSGIRPSALPHEVRDESHHSMNGHELLEGTYEVRDAEQDFESDDSLPVPAHTSSEPESAPGSEEVQGFAEETVLGENMTMEDKAELTKIVTKIMSPE